MMEETSKTLPPVQVWAPTLSDPEFANRALLPSGLNAARSFLRASTWGTASKCAGNSFTGLRNSCSDGAGDHSQSTTPPSPARLGTHKIENICLLDIQKCERFALAVAAFQYSLHPKCNRDMRYELHFL